MQRLQRIVRMTIIFIIVLTTAFLNYGAALAADYTISLKGEAIVREAEIRLGDIAHLVGAKEGLQGLKGISLGKSPLPGYKREISRELILLTLQDRGYQLGSIELNAPEIITIKTASKEISGNQLLLAAKSYLFRELPYHENNVDVKAKRYPAKLLIPDTDYSLEVQGKKDLLGSISLGIIVKVKGKQFKRVFLGLEVTVEEEVLVAVRNIDRGERIDKEDFKLEKRELSKLQGEIITDFDSDLIRYGVTRVPLAKGDVLNSKLIEKPVVISWGSEIQADVIVGSVKVSTVVKARQSGRIGDYITVENIKTGHSFKAKVISPHLVRVVRY